MLNKCKSLLLRVDRTLLKYIFAGGLNTSIAYILFAVFLFVGINYAISTFLAGVITVVLGFYVNKSFVFKVKSASFVAFAGIFLLVYFLNVSVQAMLHSFDLNGYLAGFIATFFCAFISFVLFRRLVFYGKKI